MYETGENLCWLTKIHVEIWRETVKTKKVHNAFLILPNSFPSSREQCCYEEKSSAYGTVA